MADINVNLKLNADQAEQEMAQLQQKAAALQKQLSSGLLDQKAIKATTKELAGVNKQMTELSRTTKTTELGNFADSLGVLNVGMVAAQVSLAAFNDGTEEAAEFQRKFGIAVQAAVVAQQVANIESVRARLNKTQEALATALTVKAKTSEIGVTKGLTVVQKLWNKAIAANPLGTLLAVIGAVVTAGIALYNMFSDSTEEVEEYNTAIDGTIFKSEKLKDSYNSLITRVRLLKVEHDKITGTLTEYQAALAAIDVQETERIAKRKQELKTLLDDEAVYTDETKQIRINSEQLAEDLLDKEIRARYKQQGLLTQAILQFLTNLEKEEEEAAQKRLNITDKANQDTSKKEKQAQDERLKQEKTFQDKLFKQRKDFIEKNNEEIEDDFADMISEMETDIQESMDETNEKIDENFQTYLEKRQIQIEKEKELEEIRRETIFEGLNIINQAIFDSARRRSDERLIILDETLQKELENLETLRDRQIITDIQYNQKREKLESDYNKKVSQEKTKAAKADKQGALFDIAINTAAAILRAAPNIPLQIATAALGALQAGIVAARPIPKFQDGGQFPGLVQGPSHAQGGILTPFGEIEGQEFIVNKGQTLQNLSLLKGLNASNGDMIAEMNARLDTLIALNAQPMRSYVVESDITQTQQRVKEIEENAII